MATRAEDRLQIQRAGASVLLYSGDADQLSEWLADSWTVVRVDEPRSLLPRLCDVAPDVLLVDVHSGELDAAQLTTAIRSEPVLEDTAVVLLADSPEDEAGLRALEAGANDLVVRPLSAPMLRARVRYALAVGRTCRELVGLRQKPAPEQVPSSDLDLDFLNLVSRELDTPLQEMQELLSQGDAEDAQAGSESQRAVLLARVVAMRQRLAEAIDTARLADDSPHLPVALVDLNNLLLDAEQAVDDAVQRRRLEYELEKRPLFVALDRERIAQVLAEIVNNALRTAVPATTVYITSTADQLRHRAIVRLVAERSDHTEINAMDHYLSRRVTRLHGGDLRIDADASHTTFTVELPLAGPNPVTTALGGLPDAG